MLPEWLDDLLYRLRALFRRNVVEDELDDEIRFHLEQEVEKNVASGMSPDEAQRAARRSFGTVGFLKEETRDAWGIEWLEILRQDVRLGLRQLAKSPSFTAIAVGSLAIAIGANAAIFGLVHAVVIQEMPYHDPYRVIVITEHQVDRPARSRMPRVASFDVIKEASHKESSAFESMTTWTPDGRPLPMTDPSGPEILSPGFFSADTLSFLGTQPILGRGFDSEETRTAASQLVILSNGFWMRRFGSDPEVIGRSVELNGKPAQIIGVLGPRFIIPGSERTDVWLPQHLDRTKPSGTGVLARLKPGVSLEHAQQELDMLSQRLAEALPESHHNLRLVAEPVYNRIYQGSDRGLYALWGSAGVVLLIACFNVAGLLLARVSTRQREIASRLALGSSRGRLARLLLTETALLAAAGAFGGVVLAYWSIDALISLGPLADIPRISEAAINVDVLAYTTVVCLLTALLCGLGPAFWAVRRNPGESLKPVAGGLGRQRVRSVMLQAQIALSVVLLAAAGLTAHSFLNLRTLETGYDLDNLLTFQIWLNEPEDYGKTVEIDGAPAVQISPRLDAFFQRILQGVRSLHGVVSADAVSHLPLNGYTYFAHIRADDRDVEEPVTFRAISEGYFRTMDIPLLSGRHFTHRDTSGSQWVVIINESMARACWPGEDPIGKTLYVRSDWQPVFGERLRQVVGVVADIRDDRLWPESSERKGEMFVPVQQLPQVISWLSVGSWRARMMYAIRTVGKPEMLTSAVQQVVATVDPHQPVTLIQPMRTYYTASTRESRSYMFLMSLFALVAVLLAAIGIYGSIAYTVSQRTREIGIRMALGAMQRDILKATMSRELQRAGIGVVLGLTLAVRLAQTVFYAAGAPEADSRIISLYGVGVTDPFTLAAACLLLIGVAVPASYLPARRATKVDPLVALRYE